MGSFLRTPSGKSGAFRNVFLLTAIGMAVLGLGPLGARAQSPGEEATRPAPRSLEWEEWFYGQRRYGLGYIPEEALARAVKQRDRFFGRTGYRTAAGSTEDAAWSRWARGRCSQPSPSSCPMSPPAVIFPHSVLCLDAGPIAEKA